MHFDPEDESARTSVWVGHVALFQDSYTNSNNAQILFNAQIVSKARIVSKAQIVFNAHDVSVLGDSGHRALGRDQIWLTKKDRHGATRLYPHSNFRPRRA